MPALDHSVCMRGAGISIECMAWLSRRGVGGDIPCMVCTLDVLLVVQTPQTACSAP